MYSNIHLLQGFFVRLIYFFVSLEKHIYLAVFIEIIYQLINQYRYHFGYPHFLNFALLPISPLTPSHQEHIRCLQNVINK